VSISAVHGHIRCEKRLRDHHISEWKRSMGPLLTNTHPPSSRPLELKYFPTGQTDHPAYFTLD
jgi:hypothetical protein